MLFLRSNPGSDEDDEEEDDEPPEIGDVSTFRMTESSSPLSFGYNKGRSSPTTRKAIGKSGASIASIYLCTHCGSEYVQWMGRCPTCREWNTIQQHVVARNSQDATRSPRPSFGGSTLSPPHQRPVGSWLDDIPFSSGSLGSVGNVPIRITDLTRAATAEDPNSASSIQRRIMIPDDDEFNTVLGGGIMKGSLVLLGGDPGVGKSTLLLQVAGSIAAKLSSPTPKIGMGLPSSSSISNGMGPVWYVSGEENPDQIASRAVRLGVIEDSSELYLLRQTHVDTLCEQVVSHGLNHDSGMKSDELHIQPPLPISLLVIDSIQTMVCDAGGTSFAGGITQVRECVAMFLRLAKSTNIPVLLIGHVTKSGEVAGPRTVEHSTYLRFHDVTFSSFLVLLNFPCP